MNIKDFMRCTECGKSVIDGKCEACNTEIEYYNDYSANTLGPDKKPFADQSAVDNLDKIVVDNIFSHAIMNETGSVFKDDSGVFVDIGCGTGIYSHKSFENREDVSVVGIDLNASFNFGRLSEKRMFVVADIYKHPFEKEKFDGMVSFDVIEHVEGDKEFIEKSLEMLKKGGKFAIGTPNRDRITARMVDLIKGKRKFPYDYGTDEVLGETIHVREYSLKDLQKLFSELSVDIEYKIVPIGFGLRIKKTLFGFLKPFGILKKYCIYWLVTGVKK